MLLRRNGVVQYENKDTKIVFGDHARLKDPMEQDYVPPAEENKSVKNADDVLYWSTPT